MELESTYKEVYQTMEKMEYKLIQKSEELELSNINFEAYK
jgi:hypothetical protein